MNTYTEAKEMFSIRKYLRNLLAKNTVKPIDTEIIEEHIEEIKEENEKIIKIRKVYDKDTIGMDDGSFEQAEKDFKEKLATKNVQCEFFMGSVMYKSRISKGDMIKFLTINQNYLCGNIVDIDDKYISVEINEKTQSGCLLLDSFKTNKDNLHAHARYTSDISQSQELRKVNRIITFDIIYERLRKE